MAQLPTTLALYAAIAQSAPSLPESTQGEMARLATDSKSQAGDKVLARLAVRQDLTGTALETVKRSTRAVVVAAWLSREGHSNEYVSEVISQENRVTILKTVAAHPGSSPAVLDALSRRAIPVVCAVLLARTDLDDQSALRCIETTFDREGLTSEMLRHVEGGITRYQAVWPELAAKAATPQAVYQLLTHARFQFAEPDLTRVARLVLDDWGTRIGRGALARNSSVNNRYLTQCAKLLASADWNVDSDEDREVAELLDTLQAEMQKAQGRQSPFTITGVSLECHQRHYGTPEVKLAAAQRRERRAARIAEAAVTSDPDRLRELATEVRRDVAVINALRSNPHLRLEHLTECSHRELVLACAERPSERAAAAGVLVAIGGPPVLWTKELTESEKVTAAIAAVARARGGEEDAHLSGYTCAKLFVNQALLPYIAVQLRVRELTNAIEGGHCSARTAATAAAAAAGLLSQGLQSDEQWRTFDALANELENSVKETVQVACSV
jgi:hypothetical protein